MKNYFENYFVEQMLGPKFGNRITMLKRRLKYNTIDL